MVDINRDLNMENPIFVVYVNVRGMGGQRAEDKIAEAYNHIKYTNASFWVVPITDDDWGSSRIEMIWSGSKNFNYDDDFMKEVLSVAVSDLSDREKTMRIRELKINRLANV